MVEFERVFIAGFVLGMVNLALDPGDPAAAAQSAALPPAVEWMIYGIVYALGLGLVLLLVWFVARRGSNVARWIYLALCVVGLGMGLPELGDTFARLDPAPAALVLGEYLLTLAGLWLLFQPEANAWFAGRPHGLTDIFN